MIRRTPQRAIAPCGRDSGAMRMGSENMQQTIVKTTRFFSTKEIFGRNTPFSAHLRNNLIFNRLHSQFNIPRSTPHITSCRLACFAPRYLPNGNAKHGLLSLETCLSATPLGMFRNVVAQRSRLDRIKTRGSHAISHRKACTDFSELSEHFGLPHLAATTKKTDHRTARGGLACRSSVFGSVLSSI